MYERIRERPVCSQFPSVFSARHPSSKLIAGRKWLKMLAVTTMPKQAPLRLIKRCRLYLKRGDWKESAPITRGIYVLSRQGTPSGTKKKVFKVVYIGVGALQKTTQPGVGQIIRNTDETNPTAPRFPYFQSPHH